MVTILPETRWPELTEVFKEYFEGADLPTPGQAFIIADLDEEGEILAFRVLEQLWRIGQVFGNGGSPRGLFDYVENKIQSGSVIGIAGEPRFETLFAKYGMRKIDGTLYRRDF